MSAKQGILLIQKKILSSKKPPAAKPVFPMHDKINTTPEQANN